MDDLPSAEATWTTTLEEEEAEPEEEVGEGEPVPLELEEVVEAAAGAEVLALALVGVGGFIELRYLRFIGKSGRLSGLEESIPGLLRLASATTSG